MAGSHFAHDSHFAAPRQTAAHAGAFKLELSGAEILTYTGACLRQREIEPAEMVPGAAFGQ